MTIELLAANWLAAKHTEDSARALRLDIEVQMLAQLPAVEEGVAKATCGAFQIGATYRLTRKVDTERLKDDWDTLPGRVQAAFTWKADVSITNLRAMEKAAPLNYAKALHYITTSPAKPAIKIEEI
jgi:hypothetical protein